MNVGIFLPNWVGDLVMATPTLRALRRHYRDARIIGVGRPHLADVLAGTEWLDAYLPFDPRGNDRQYRGGAFIAQLRAERLDVVLLLTNSLRTGWLAWRSGASRRVGYVRFGRGWMLTDKLYHRRAGGRYVPRPVLDDYLRIAYAVGCPPESPALELTTQPAHEATADEVWQQCGLGRDQRPVAFNCGGAFGAAKLWPKEYFAELASRLATEQGVDVLVLCGPAERETARDIAREAGHRRVHSLAGVPPSLGLTKACVRRSRLLVTTDSGPRHFAAAFNVPVITLFGPTHIAWSETHYPHAVHLQHDVPCGPCQQRVCPLGHHRCMRDLSVDHVYGETVKMLKRDAESFAA